MRRDSRSGVGAARALRVAARLAASSLAVSLTACPSSDPERAIPSEYHEPPADCAPSDELLPVVAMPWRHALETFLPAGTSADAALVDYDVWPRAHADEVFVDFAFDRTAAIDPITLEGECPSRLDLADLRARAVASSTMAGDVVHLRVVAGDDDTARQGDLFFTTGEASIEVQVPELARGSAVPWLLFFEPAWGEPRVAARVVEPSELSAATLRLDGLPRGGGVVGLVEVGEALTRDEETGAFYLPDHFAEDWPAYTRQFRAALFERFPTAPLSLAEGADLGTRNADLVETPELSTDHAMGLLIAPDDGLELGGVRPEVQGRVSVACGTRVHAFTPSLSDVTFHLPAASPGADPPPPVALGPGAAVDLDVACDGDRGLLGISTRPQNQRDTRLWLSVVTP